MPSNAVRSSSNCCTGREPPSPDGLAPRPAESPTSSTRIGISKDPTRSWTSADVIELHAIFENEIKDSDASHQIKLNKFRGGITDVFESDVPESEPESDQIRPKSSSHTLKAVTEKLKKHISMELAVAKRHARSSIGTSEGEIERRAELRRIRQRRIQEELSNESIYDDDAKSLSTLVDSALPMDKKAPIVCTSESSVPLLLPLTPSALPQPTQALLELSSGEMDAASSSAKKIPKADSVSNDMSTTLQNSNDDISRQNISPLITASDTIETGPRVYIPLRNISPSSDVPRAPTLEPTRLPSIAEPDGIKSPWRLSFTAEHRGEGLRKLSLGSVIPVTLDIEKAILSSGTTDATTHSDSPRDHPNNLVESSHEGINLGATGSHAQTCCGSADYGGVDGSDDNAATVHLQEMDISHNLAFKGPQSSVSSPQLSSSEPHQGESTAGESQPLPISSDLVDTLRHIEESIGVTKRNASGSFFNRSSRYSSSRYSDQLLGGSPRFNLLSLLPRPKSKTNDTVDQDGAAVVGEDIKHKATEEHKLPTELPLLTTANRSPTPVPISCGQELTPIRPMNDDISLVASETSSFRAREEELLGLQTRFAERRVLSTPVSSKFREEFEKPDLPSRKPSVLARLARLARRSYDGTIDGTVDRTDLLDLPVPTFDPNLLLSPGIGTKSPYLNEDAENMWASASKGKDKEDEKEEKTGIFRRKKSRGAGEKKRIGLFGRKKKEESAAERYKHQLEESMAANEFAMDSWEMEMEATAAKAKTKSKNIVKKTKYTQPDRRFPASWARYPSHDRQERVYSASAKDNVEVKDFAKLGLLENGDVLWCLAHDEDGHHTIIDGLGRKKGIGERFIQKVEKELYEFDTQDDQRAQTNGRRGSLTVSCELEYPELEILPVMFMDQEEMQKHEEKKEEFETTVAKDEELDEIAKLLGGGFDGVMSRKKHGGMFTASGSGSGSGDPNSDGDQAILSGASDWEDELIMSSGDERETKPCSNIADPSYYADCVIMKSTFASPIGTPHGTVALRTDILEELLRVPASPEGSPQATAVRAEKREKFRTWSGKDWNGYRYDGSVTGGNERKLSLGSVVMRKSTDDLVGELARREDEERHSLLQAVEDAFGRSSE